MSCHHIPLPATPYTGLGWRSMSSWGEGWPVRDEVMNRYNTTMVRLHVYWPFKTAFLCLTHIHVATVRMATLITSNNIPPTTPPITGASSVPEECAPEDGVPEDGVPEIPTSDYKTDWCIMSVFFTIHLISKWMTWRMSFLTPAHVLTHAPTLTLLVTVGPTEALRTAAVVVCQKVLEMRRRCMFLVAIYTVVHNATLISAGT